MLMGEYMHTIDAKGRVILPADFRSELGESFIITKGLDSCLFIYTMTEWENLSTKLKQLPLAKAEARAFVRFFFSSSLIPNLGTYLKRISIRYSFFFFAK